MGTCILLATCQDVAKISKVNRKGLTREVWSRDEIAVPSFVLFNKFLKQKNLL